jgi:hypothetical protein
METRDLTPEITAKTSKIPCNWSSLASTSELALARRNVIEINNMTSNMTSLEAAMSPELN